MIGPSTRLHVVTRLLCTVVGVGFSVGCGAAEDTFDTPSYWPVDPEVNTRCAGIVPTDGQEESGVNERSDDATASDDDMHTMAPGWTLPDVQPESCGFQEAYGLSTFRGRILVVALLASW